MNKKTTNLKFAKNAILYRRIAYKFVSDKNVENTKLSAFWGYIFEILCAQKNIKNFFKKIFPYRI